MFGDKNVMEAMRWLIRREYEDRRVAEGQAEDARNRIAVLLQRQSMYESFLKEREFEIDYVEECWRQKGYGVPN